MRLFELVSDLAIDAGRLDQEGWDVEVTGVAHDSRRVEPGDLFAALAGAQFDGRQFVPQALERGAVAVLSAPPAVDAGAVPSLVTADPRAVLGELSGRAYGHADRELVMVGVTGTNGKSTVVQLVTVMLERAGRPAGTIGTLGYRFRDQRFEGVRTTPEAPDLHRCLRRMRDAGAEAVAMEVSSHALSLGRVRGIGFAVSVFTNLSRDHLDHHGDLESYFASKRVLFDQLQPGGTAVVNLEDAYGERLARTLAGPVITYGADGDVRAARAELDRDGIRATLATPRGTLELESPLLGRYNLSNLLAAVAVGEALRLPQDAIQAGISRQQPLPGRLEPVDCGQSFPVYVDYAHTPAALEAALQALREIWPGGIVLVFGCGGERDPGKRPIMGQLAGDLAEHPILTADNPRGEDPHQINAAVEAGLRQSANWDYQVIPDRREAIRTGVSLAASRPGLALLVAGKGHEEVQILGEVRRPFSDREELERCLEELEGGAAGD